MKIIIWGSGEFGKCIYNLMGRTRQDVIAFVDSNDKLIGSTIEKVPVISFEKIERIIGKEKLLILLALRNSYNIISVLNKVDNYNIDSIGIVKPRILAKNELIILNENEETGEIIWVKKTGKKYNLIPRLELNIVDGCNLNCKGCSHFSSLFPKESVYPVLEYKKDLNQIRKAGKLVRLRLLGGEPFLSEKLVDYVLIARTIFPETDIELVTNGLLIPNIEENILEEIKKNNISISITPYLPTLKIRGEIEKRLNMSGIWWRFDGKKVQEFWKNLTLEKNHNDKKSSENCMEQGCIFLRCGKIYKCPLEGLIFILEKNYNIKFDTIKRGIDIYDNAEKLYNNILDLIKEPVEMCQYCSEEKDCTKWEVKNIPILQDWLLEEGKI